MIAQNIWHYRIMEKLVAGRMVRLHCKPTHSTHRKKHIMNMFGTFVTIVSIVLFASASSPGSPPSTDYKTLAHDIFRELIEINTSTSIGCTKAAEAMALRFRAAGFDTAQIQIVGPHPDHMNLVVRLRGTGALKPLLFIGHLDVVEARREDWSSDPFVFLEKNGYFYGRGTSDMKGNVAELVTTFIRLKQERFLPDRDLILALTEDEEGGNFNGVDWLIKNRRDLIDAEFCINGEGGGGSAKNGKPQTLSIQTAEKVYISFNLDVTNPGGHSSVPMNENAIYRLAEALVRLSKLEFPVHLNETTRVFFKTTAQIETGPMKQDLEALTRLPLDTAAAGRIGNAVPRYRSMMRTTCVATMLTGGHAENALPQLARATVNCRMLPDETIESVREAIQTTIADSQVTITLINTPSVSPLSPIRSDLWKPIEAVAAKMWPAVRVTPIMLTGATDGKFLRQAGIPTYGFDGIFYDVEENRAHGRDERVGVKEFYDGVDFRYVIVKMIAAKSN